MKFDNINNDLLTAHFLCICSTMRRSDYENAGKKPVSLKKLLQTGNQSWLPASFSIQLYSVPAAVAKCGSQVLSLTVISPLQANDETLRHSAEASYEW
jgi:hypothetical protein